VFDNQARFIAREKAPGMGAVMRRSERPVRCEAPHFLFRRRGLAAQETTAPDLQKPAFREPHLSGQPGGCDVRNGRSVAEGDGRPWRRQGESRP